MWQQGTNIISVSTVYRDYMWWLIMSVQPWHFAFASKLMLDTDSSLELKSFNLCAKFKLTTGQAPGPCAVCAFPLLWGVSSLRIFMEFEYNVLYIFFCRQHYYFSTTTGLAIRLSGISKKSVVNLCQSSFHHFDASIWFEKAIVHTAKMCIQGQFWMHIFFHDQCHFLQRYATSVQ